MKDLVHLQYIGQVPGKPAADFEVGEVMMWNSGAKTKVLGIVGETKAFLTFELECLDATSRKLTKNIVHERRLKKDRLVAIG